MPRIPLVDPSNLNAEQQVVYDNIMKTRNRLPPTQALWLHNPALADPMEKLAFYLRYRNCLPRRLSEFAILLMAKHWQGQYCWIMHKPLALKEGLSPEIIEAVRIGEKPEFTRPDEAAAYEFATTLIETHEMPEELYERAIAILGRSGVMDLMAVFGYYTLPIMLDKVFTVELPPGKTPELPSK